MNETSNMSQLGHTIECKARYRKKEKKSFGINDYLHLPYHNLPILEKIYRLQGPEWGRKNKKILGNLYAK